MLGTPECHFSNHTRTNSVATTHSLTQLETRKRFFVSRLSFAGHYKQDAASLLLQIDSYGLK